MRRLRSSTVVLGGMGVLAATITACGAEPDRRCRTGSRAVPPASPGPRTGGSVDDDDDDNGSSSRGAYYYGGSVSNARVSGGSFDKKAVDTGGFGCSSSGSSGG